MSLYETIGGDLKAAMKSGDRARVDALRFSLASINAFQKEKQIKTPGASITDEELITVLQKEAKRKKESIELFNQGNRKDLAEKEEADLAIIQVYMPKELSREELEKMVSDVMAAGAADFNAVMRETMKLVKGRADGKMVGEVIKAKLG
jgi:uncharacterized protein YqeY